MFLNIGLYVISFIDNGNMATLVFQINVSTFLPGKHVLFCSARKRERERERTLFL